ncbi:MAG: hypothetical protein ACUVTM_00695 [Candidatus Bathyarchaeia archaeon]
MWRGYWLTPEAILAYEIALRTLDMRDLESTRLFIEIARVLRDIQPRRRRRLEKVRSLLRFRGRKMYY